MLKRAHRSMELGEHANAAALFEQLARTAHDRNRLRQAPRLYLQAARGYILSRDMNQAETQIWIGLKILAEEKKWGQLHRLGDRVVIELQEWEQPELAEDVKSWLLKTLPEAAAEKIHGKVASHRRQLPLKCPSCGGALIPDEIEWLDANTGECSFCGSAVRGK
ncbi:MAG: hypothetical protein ABFS03_09245 [Chloroflexota bacterium]